MQEAAAVRAEIRAVVHKNVEDAREKTSSDTVTSGVRIKVRRCIALNVLESLLCFCEQHA